MRISPRLISLLLLISPVAMQAQSADIVPGGVRRRPDTIPTDTPVPATPAAPATPPVVDPAVPVPVPTPAPEGENAAYLDKLPKDKKAAVFMINTGNGAGTGFVAKLRGKLFLITNLHVLFGAKNITAANEVGRTLKLGAIYGAADHDVAIIEVLDPSVPFLEIEEKITEVAAVNDAVLIPGNSLGGSTILQTGGKIAAFGPRVIEHDAPVYQGNSGSPILLEKNWKVVGIMTYVSKVDLAGDWIKDSAQNQDSQIKAGVRYFGFRFDSITNWYPIQLRQWQQQCDFLLEKKKRMIAVASFYANSRKREWTDDREISDRLRETETKLRKMSQPYFRREEAKSFLRFLQTRMDTDARSIGVFEQSAYPFLKDGECNHGECSASLKAFGQRMVPIIGSSNESALTRIGGN